MCVLCVFHTPGAGLMSGLVSGNPYARIHRMMKSVIPKHKDKWQSFSQAFFSMGLTGVFPWSEVKLLDVTTVSVTVTAWPEQERLVWNFCDTSVVTDNARH